MGNIVPCRAHRSGGLCHGTNSGNLVLTTLITGGKGVKKMGKNGG